MVDKNMVHSDESSVQSLNTSKYLIIDPGHSTGYCLVSICFLDKSKIGTILEYGFYEVNNKSEYVGDWCIDLQKWLEDKIKKENILEVIREDYFFSKQFKTGSSVNVSYRTAIDITSRGLKLPYHVISPSTWKSFICGRSTPTKEQKTIYGNKEAKKYMIQEALYSKYKIKFPNYLKSHKNGRNIKFKHDIVDAVAMGIYFLRIIKDVDSVICDVKCPLDIIWKGKVKIFNYDLIPNSSIPIPNKKNKLKSNVKSITSNSNSNKSKKIEIKTCQHIFTRGNKKNEFCEIRIRGDYDRCSKHRCSKHRLKYDIEDKKIHFDENISKPNTDLKLVNIEEYN